MDNKKTCLERLEQTSTNFLTDNLTDDDKNIIDLLSEIIVVEKETISADRLFNQLKENYFESDDATITFIDNLYDYNIDTLSDYLDIYIEQAYENEMDENYINEKIYRITDILRRIKPELVILLEQKLTNVSGSSME